MFDAVALVFVSLAVLEEVVVVFFLGVAGFFFGVLPSFSIFSARSAARCALRRMTRSICSRRSASVWRATGIAAEDEDEDAAGFALEPFVGFFSGSEERLTGI